MIYGVLGLLSVVITGFALLVTGLFMISGQMGWINDLADNTVVVLWSDHGWQLGEKEHWRKFALWENVLRTVLMIRAPTGSPGLPGGSKNGAQSRRIVSLQDIYPTLVDLCGLPSRGDEIDGRSLVPLLRDPSGGIYDLVDNARIFHLELILF